jgi:hypothetical protein
MERNGRDLSCDTSARARGGVEEGVRGVNNGNAVITVEEVRRRGVEREGEGGQLPVTEQGV